MHLRFRYKPRGQRARSRLVNVPRRHLLLAQRIAVIDPMKSDVIDISPEFIAAFEARHGAEVLEVRRPFRRRARA